MELDGQDRSRDLLGCGVLVIGGTRGIGLAVAERLVSRGGTVTISYLHDPATGERAVEQLAGLGGPDVMAVRADAADGGDCRRLFEQAYGRLGRLDVVVHTVGRMIKKPLRQISDAEYDRVMADNVRGAFFTLRECANSIGDHGRIVLVSSTLTEMRTSQHGVYSAAKAAVEQLVRTAATEFGSRGVTVNAVSPGPVDTLFLRDQESAESLAALAGYVPSRRLGLADDIAPLVSFLTREEARWVNAQIIRVNGGMH